MLPRIILHNAVSLDNQNRGFEVDLAQYYGLIPHFKEHATLAGSGTILAAPEAAQPDDGSDPPPTPSPRDKRPLMVIPDSRGRVRCWHVLQAAGYWRGFVALCSRATPKGYRDYLKRRRVDCIVAGADRVDLRAALKKLNERYGVKTVRADSGGTLNGLLLRAGLVDEISLLIHPVVVGGASPQSSFLAPGPMPGKGVSSLKLAHLEKLSGGLVWVRYKVVR